MNKYILIFISVFLFSCKTQKTDYLPCMAIYKREPAGRIDASCIILKTQPNIFEIYVPSTYASIIGEWEVTNDTLHLFPKYDYYASEKKMKMTEIVQNKEDLSFLTINQQYLLTKDSLVDITDYSIFSPELSEIVKRLHTNRAIYRRVMW